MRYINVQAVRTKAAISLVEKLAESQRTHAPNGSAKQQKARESKQQRPDTELRGCSPLVVSNPAISAFLQQWTGASKVGSWVGYTLF